jgi:hypothetical protein
MASDVYCGGTCRINLGLVAPLPGARGPPPRLPPRPGPSPGPSPPPIPGPLPSPVPVSRPGPCDALDADGTCSRRPIKDSVADARVRAGMFSWATGFGSIFGCSIGSTTTGGATGPCVGLARVASPAAADRTSGCHRRLRRPRARVERSKRSDFACLSTTRRPVRSENVSPKGRTTRAGNRGTRGARAKSRRLNCGRVLWTEEGTDRCAPSHYDVRRARLVFRPKN